MKVKDISWRARAQVRLRVFLNTEDTASAEKGSSEMGMADELAGEGHIGC
jgi:hypothetical protein